MARYIVGLLFAVLVGNATSQAFALASDYSKEQLKSSGNVGGQVPIHGYWVNSADVFFYAGEAKAFNQFVEAYSKLKHAKLKVVIHPGATNASSPWDKGPRNEPADWSLYVSNTGDWNTGDPLKPPAEVPGRQEGDNVTARAPAPTRVDVWVGPRLKLRDLRIPAGLDVTASKEVEPSGEIAEFIGRRKAQPATTQPGTAIVKSREPFRLSVDLRDGSRLLGQARDVRDLALQTGFGKVVIPLEQVESIQFLDDNGAVTIRLPNGDRLTGAMNPADWGELKLLTVVGEIKVPVQLMQLCAIDPAPRKAKVVGVRAVSSWESCTPDKAFDGKHDGYWNSGDYAPAWIEADLGDPQPLADILLIPVQDIPGPTTHEIWVSNEPIGNDRTRAKLVHSFQGETKNEQPLKFDFPKELSARYVQVRTTQSPTWIAWWEVEIRVRERGQPRTVPPKPQTEGTEKPTGKSAGDKEALQGVWQVFAVEFDGKQATTSWADTKKSSSGWSRTAGLPSSPKIRISFRGARFSRYVPTKPPKRSILIHTLWAFTLKATS